MRPRRSLLSKVVNVISLTCLGIVLVAFFPFVVLYRGALLDERAELLQRCAARGRTAWQESLEGGVAPVSSMLPAEPVVTFLGPEVTAFVFPEDGNPLGFNADHELTPVTEVTDPLRLAAGRVKQLRDSGEDHRSLRRGPELVHLEQISGQSPEARATLYFAISLTDLEQRVLKFAAFSLGSGLVALLVFGSIAILVLRATLLDPLNALMQADHAGRTGDIEAALIADEAFPDDELGTIMDSRNRLLRQQQSYRESIDAKNAALSRQQEALRRWGEELERVVERKSEELMEARATLFEQEKLAALGRLAANVAHEINTPLSSIAGYAEEMRDILHEAPLPEGHEDWQELPGGLRIVEEQAFRCKDILTRLLGLARSERVHLTEVDLGELVRDVVVMTEPSARRREVALSAHTSTAPGPMLESDRSALVQIATNLIENAIDAANAARESRGGEAEVRVSVSERSGPEAEREVLLRVRDNGFGIPPEQQEKIFDEFFTTKPIGRGTGLGLAICQTMTRRLGGRIEVESLAGEGAAFSVVLPCRPKSGSLLLETAMLRVDDLPPARPELDVGVREPDLDERNTAPFATGSADGDER